MSRRAAGGRRRHHHRLGRSPHLPSHSRRQHGPCLGGTNRNRLTKIFNGLAEGGKIKGPLAKQPSGAEVGWLMDKFSINWMVSIDKA
jgi:uncharacterized glyoxalase superfamily protein PhnB